MTQRQALLRQAQATGVQLPAAPGPQDVHPTAYANAVGPPVAMPGSVPTGSQSTANGNGEAPPSLLMHPLGSGPGRSIFTRSDSRGTTSAVEGGILLSSPRSALPVPPSSSVGPCRGGAHPPIILMRVVD